MCCFDSRAVLSSNLSMVCCFQKRRYLTSNPIKTPEKGHQRACPTLVVCPDRRRVCSVFLVRTLVPRDPYTEIWRERRVIFEHVTKILLRCFHFFVTTAEPYTCPTHACDDHSFKVKCPFCRRLSQRVISFHHAYPPIFTRARTC